MASFTDVGDSVVLDIQDKDEKVDIAISGTYNMTIVFQRELGSRGSGAFITLKSYSTANATVAESYVTQSYNERVRLLVTVDTSGTAVATLAINTIKQHDYLTIRDRVGNVLMTFDSDAVRVVQDLEADEVRPSDDAPKVVAAASGVAISKHVGDGVNMTVVATLTNVALTVGSSENLGVGVKILTLPAGNLFIRDAHFTVGFGSVTTTNDTPEIGLGTVIASGAVTVLGGTATFENIIEGAATADTNGTAKVSNDSRGLAILTGGSHDVYCNMADGWGANADKDGLLNGTVVIRYSKNFA